MKKNILEAIIFIVIMIVLCVYGINRFEKIESGQMTLVNQNQMDR